MNSTLSSRGPLQAKVGGALNTNAQTYVNLMGISDLIVYKSIFLHLLMQAMEVEEHFHVQHMHAERDS